MPFITYTDKQTILSGVGLQDLTEAIEDDQREHYRQVDLPRTKFLGTHIELTRYLEQWNTFFDQQNVYYSQGDTSGGNLILTLGKGKLPFQGARNDDYRQDIIEIHFAFLKNDIPCSFLMHFHPDYPNEWLIAIEIDTTAKLFSDRKLILLTSHKPEWKAGLAKSEKFTLNSPIKLSKALEGSACVLGIVQHILSCNFEFSAELNVLQFFSQSTPSMDKDVDNSSLLATLADYENLPLVLNNPSLRFLCEIKRRADASSEYNVTTSQLEQLLLPCSALQNQLTLIEKAQTETNALTTYKKAMVTLWLNKYDFDQFIPRLLANEQCIMHLASILSNNEWLQLVFSSNESFEAFYLLSHYSLFRQHIQLLINDKTQLWDKFKQLAHFDWNLPAEETVLTLCCTLLFNMPDITVETLNEQINGLRSLVNRYIDPQLLAQEIQQGTLNTQLVGNDESTQLSLALARSMKIPADTNTEKTREQLQTTMAYVLKNFPSHAHTLIHTLSEAIIDKNISELLANPQQLPEYSPRKYHVLTNALYCMEHLNRLNLAATEYGAILFNEQSSKLHQIIERVEHLCDETQKRLEEKKPKKAAHFKAAEKVYRTAIYDAVIAFTQKNEANSPQHMLDLTNKIKQAEEQILAITDEEDFHRFVRYAAMVVWNLVMLYTLGEAHKEHYKATGKILFFSSTRSTEDFLGLDRDLLNILAQPA